MKVMKTSLLTTHNTHRKTPLEHHNNETFKQQPQITKGLSLSSLSSQNNTRAKEERKLIPIHLRFLYV